MSPSSGFWLAWLFTWRESFQSTTRWQCKNLFRRENACAWLMGTACVCHAHSTAASAKWKPIIVLALKAGNESAPCRACCTLLFCWGRELCRGKLRGGKACLEYLFLVLPGHQAILVREKIPSFSTASSRAAPATYRQSLLKRCFGKLSAIPFWRGFVLLSLCACST